MWCLSILCTLTYPTILHCCIILPLGGLLVKILKEVPYSYLERNCHDMVPCGAYQYCTHLLTQQFSHFLIILPPGGLLVKIYKEVRYSCLDWNAHDMVPCGAYKYCTYLSTQKFYITLLFYLHCSNFTTRGTFSKNLSIGPILLFRMELTEHCTMWCLSILYTFTYPTTFTLLYYSTTRGTFSKNVQRGTMPLFRMELT